MRVLSFSPFLVNSLCCYDSAKAAWHKEERVCSLGQDLASLPVGWIELGNGVRASVQHYQSLDECEAFFETHDKYFDVQYVVEGQELCGVCSRSGLTVKAPYSVSDDITFYENPDVYGNVLLSAGDFILLTPEDAHRPRITASEKRNIKKIVIKVPV